MADNQNRSSTSNSPIAVETSLAKPTPDPALILEFCQALMQPGQVHEVRIPKTRRSPARLYRTVSGYFDSPEAVARALKQITGEDAQGVYITLNPVNADLLARAVNRLESNSNTTTADADVVRRTTLLIDIDPQRPAGISANAAEQRAALQTRDAIQTFLTEDHSWPEPLAVMESGNGGGLLYRIDLPNDAPSKTLIEQVLKHLACAFNGSEVSIDTGVANAARIGKVGGTVAAKGDHTADRPWRLATGTFRSGATPVEVTQLQDVANRSALARLRSTPMSDRTNRAWSIREVLDGQGIGYIERDQAYGTVYSLDRCLTSDAHADGACIIEFPSGALSYRCHHASCEGRTWADAKSALGLSAPHHIDLSLWMTERSDQSQPTIDSNLAASSQRVAARTSAIYLSEVAAEHVKWLSVGRLAKGKLTVLDGDPGLGKSTLVVDWAARISRGDALPDGAAGPARGIVLLSVEDGLADTIRPRLEAAQADLGRILALTQVPEGEAGRGYSIPQDIPLIEQHIRDADAALFVIDPLMATLGGETNSYRDQDVRRALAPLTAMAERTGVAVIIVRHLNKTAGGHALYRGGGSIGIIGAARCGLLVAADPDDPEARVLASTKSNLAKAPDALRFSLVTDADRDVARVRYLGPSHHTADALLAMEATDTNPHGREEAKEWLRLQLAEGPVLSREIQSLGRKDGFSMITLRRAKADLNIKAKKNGMEGGWSWELPYADSNSLAAAWDDEQTVPIASDSRQPQTLSSHGSVTQLPIQTDPVKLIA